jgi:hypothetical protein
LPCSTDIQRTPGSAAPRNRPTGAERWGRIRLTYTVNSHIQHIYRKQGIHKRAELISYLHRNG